MGRFDGQICLLTASATGIGLAIADRLASEGAKVVISSRSQVHVDEAVAQLRAKGYTAAGTVAWAERDYQRLVDFTVETYGGVDLVVANAAMSKHIGKFSETPAAIARKTFELNTLAPFFLVQAALPYLRKSNSPAVLFTGTNMTFYPTPKVGMYAVSKLALLGISQMLALDLISEGIRFNVISPGLIDTRFGSLMKDWVKFIPLRRAGSVEEVASLAAFLLSKEAKGVAGACVSVAGGLPNRL
jgi:dehydrogenase/reductase SDR family protein 4